MLTETNNIWVQKNGNVKHGNFFGAIKLFFKMETILDHRRLPCKGIHQIVGKWQAN